MHKITIALVFTITSLSAWAKPQIVTHSEPANHELRHVSDHGQEGP